MNALRRVARQAMRDTGFSRTSRPSWPSSATLTLAARESSPGIRDLRQLLWASIDNDDSRDLDQLSAAEPLANGAVRVFVAIADVDCLVKAGTPIDAHATANTTSVYTAAEIFPMLPEKLSTDLTSLAEHQDRLSVVVQMTFDAAGATVESDIYQAMVRKPCQARLQRCGRVAEWNSTETARPRVGRRHGGADSAAR